MSRSPYRPQPSTMPDAPRGKPVFDVGRPLAELVDKLAEEQAKMIDDLTSSQLRRFFGDVKDLYRQWQQGSDYKAQIEPRFKMIRSKASYAWRNGQNKKAFPQSFHDFLDQGINKVQNETQFSHFVQHFEAVVGFLYGTGKVGK